jgi:hypothetical protein
MLPQHYAPTAVTSAPMRNWSPDEIEAHIAFPRRLNEELTERGELVDAQALTGPDMARTVTPDDTSAPVVTDGPFRESKDLLAGYGIVDVESRERAIEIASQASAAPGPGGVAIEQPIEVREVMGV